MKRLFLFPLILLAPLLFQSSCSSNSSPAAPQNQNPPAATNTFTLTAFPSLTSGPSSTLTPTPSPTGTLSATLTFTPTGSHTSTFTRTYSPTITSTFTAVFTDTPACGSFNNFGNVIDGGSHGIFSNYFACKAVVSDSAPVTLTSLTADFNILYGQVRAAVYDDSGGAPNNLVVQSAALSPAGAGTTSGWVQLDLPDTTLSSPATYWLALQMNTNTQIKYDTGPAGCWTGDNSVFPFGDFPLTFGSSTISSTYFLSLYANYCPPALPGTPTFTRTPIPTNTLTPTITPTFTPIPTDTPACGSFNNFGNVIDGGSHGIFSNYFACKAIVSDSAPVTLTSLTADFNILYGQVRAAVYDDLSGAPNNLIVQSGILSPAGTGTASGWIQLDLPDTTLSSPATYWLALQTNTNTQIEYGTGPAGVYVGDNSVFPFGDFPSTFGTSTISSTYFLSLYANYCPPALPGTPTFTRTPIPTNTLTPTITPTFTPIPTDTPACGSPSHFGYNAVGASHGIFSNYFACKAVLSGPSSVTLTSLTADFNILYGQIRAAVYDDLSGAPNNLIVQSAILSPAGGGTTSGWVQLDLPDTTLPSPATYWLALQMNTNTQIDYDNGPSGSWAGANYVFPFGDFPSPFGESPIPGVFLLSLYANTCP